MVNRAVERAILQIVEQLEETGYRRDNSGGDNGKQVSNSTTATQTDVSPTSGSRQQRYPPRPSDSAATNNSTQGTCTHTLSMQYIGGAGPCGISIGPLNVLNCQGNTAAHEGELSHPTDSTQSKFVKYLPKKNHMLADGGSAKLTLVPSDALCRCQHPYLILIPSSLHCHTPNQAGRKKN